jgi:hypothetical protein
MFWLVLFVVVLGCGLGRLFIRKIKNEDIQNASQAIFNGLVSIVLLLLYIAVKVGKII